MRWAHCMVGDGPHAFDFHALRVVELGNAEWGKTGRWGGVILNIEMSLDVFKDGGGASPQSIRI